MDTNKKVEIKIENFKTLVLQPSSDSIDKQNSNHTSDLASFRINPENTSSNQSSPMDLSHISPIKAIVNPSRNFTTESENFISSSLTPNFIKIMPTETDEEDEDLQQSIKILASSLKKTRITQCTPTFPLKPGANVSWNDVSIPNTAEKRIEDCYENSNPDKFPVENGPGTVSELPSMIDERIFGCNEASDDRIDVNPEENREITEKAAKDAEKSPQLAEKSEKKFKLVQENVFEKTELVKKEIKKVRYRAVSHLRIMPETLLSVNGETFANTPMVSKSLGKFETGMKIRARSIGKMRIQKDVSGALKGKGMVKLPELRERMKGKVGNPYLSGLNKNGFGNPSGIVKKQKEVLVINNLVARVVKRKKVVMK